MKKHLDSIDFDKADRIEAKFRTNFIEKLEQFHGENYSWNSIGEAIGTCESTAVYRWWNEKKLPSWYLLIRLCLLMKISPNELFGVKESDFR